MNYRPPLQPMRQSLPFHDSAFGWDTFEDFFCDFLNAQPEFVINDGAGEIRRRVIRARPFGRKGDKQRGIDLLAEVDGGEVWDFQCKHVKKWTPAQTRKAITAYKRDAPRRFLLVTCEVSEECQNIVKSTLGWEIWDGREINRRFRDSIKVAMAAPILFTHFGPGWAEAFFGVSGDGPLIGAEAKFATQLRAGVRFHHRLDLVGRKALIKQLDEFVHDPKARVFILTGRGGLGKSRLLLHWSRNFNRRHSNGTLLFLSDKCADFGPSLQVAPRPLTIAFDDAHRLDDVRRALFHELPSREDIKLVLSLRPGPIGQVMQELLGAGFDTTDILAAAPMKPLTHAEQMTLVEAALKPQFLRHKHFLRKVSRDCPLIAVIGAELINSGALTSGDLHDEKEVQNRVFESLLGDAGAVREKFGALETDDFLRLVALLGPVKLDAAFFAKAAPFLGIEQPDRVSHLRDALDGVGLLHTTGAGTRVTPDLLSDHLAFTACYDQAGRSRGFAKRVLDHFSPDEFPKLMQHLAEAEWRAVDEKLGTESIIEPLWKWFRERFEASSFYERQKQISEWGNIAYLQPQRSLELAELALARTTAAPPDNEWLKGHEWNSHAYSVESLPRMLVGVAEHHPEYVERCFDLLWQLGRDKPAGSNNADQSHPISCIGEVLTYKLWKSLDLFNSALDWLDRLLRGHDWHRHLHKPGWLLAKFFTPIFATSIGENWMTGNTMHMQSHLLSLPKTAPFRARVLAICRNLLARRDEHLAIQIIPVLDKACDIARLGFGGSPPQQFVEEWNRERLKSLAVMEEMVRDFAEPLIHFQVRHTLMRDLRYGKDSSVYRDACRKIVHAIPDTLDLRIARTAFGNSFDEFERDTNEKDWQTITRIRWETFIREVADAVHTAYPHADLWLAHLAVLDVRWRAFDGFQPNFRHLLVALVERHPIEGVAAADLLLADTKHPLAHAFDAIVIPATKNDEATRMRLIPAAAVSDAELLQASAVACCSWWRREGELPEAAWQMLESFGSTATPLVADRIVNFVWWNDKRATLRDWNLITALPFTPSQTEIAGHIAARAAELIKENQLKPDAESVSRFLSRFESLAEPKGYNLEHAFEELAEAFPVEMFLMLWRRNRARKAGDKSLKSLPYDFNSIRFPRIMEAPEVKTLVADFEQRCTSDDALDFDEMRLLRAAIQHGSANPSAWLEAAANRSTSEEQLETLRSLGSVGEWENAALSYPNFARTLLIRARTISSKCHEQLFSRLLHVGGCRGSTNHEPDDEWKNLLAAIERLAHQHDGDEELGPLFTAIAKRERLWADSSRSRASFEDEDENSE